MYNVKVGAEKSLRKAFKKNVVCSSHCKALKTKSGKKKKNLTIQQAEVGAPLSCGQLGLHIELQSILGYTVRLFQTIMTKK